MTRADPDRRIRPILDREELLRALRALRARRHQPVDAQTAALRSEGLVFVAEARAALSAEEVAALCDGFDPELSVEPLFPEFSREGVPERLQPFYLLRLPGVSSVEFPLHPFDVAYGLREAGEFVSVEPDLPYTNFLGAATFLESTLAGATPEDRAWWLRDIRAPAAWALPPTSGKQDGEGVSVAHLDTGWTNHVDLDQVNFDLSRAMDFITPGGNAQDPMNYGWSQGHGTRTGSVIMSRGGIGPLIPPGTLPPGQVTGVARKSTYVPLRCVWSVVLIFSYRVAQAIWWATAQSCDVISMSLGGFPLWALHQAILNAVSQDRLVVAAAGNDVGLVVYPARYAQTIAVAASNFDDQPWPKSSRGKTVDISAPGQDVWHAEPDPAGVLDTAGSGTSYSTATLAGVAALWLAFHERTALQAQLAPGQMLQEAFRSVLKHTARIPPGGWDQQHFGWGIVDAFEALNLGVSQIPSLFAGGAPTAPDPAQEVLETAVDADPETSKAVFGKTLEGGVLPPDEMLAAFSLELIRAIMEDGRLRELLERASTGQIRIGEAARMARVLLEPRVSRTFQHAAGWALER